MEGLFNEELLTSSAAGAVIGFLLAQVADLVRRLFAWWARPVLEFRLVENHVLLSHTAESEHGYLQEVLFGFGVHNRGKSVATGVRCQILKISHRRDDESEFEEFPNSALNLCSFSGAGSVTGSDVVTVVPDATVVIGLAYWRQDIDVIRPLAANVFDYYDEITESSHVYRFEVVAFDDTGRYVTQRLSVEHPCQSSKNVSSQ